MDLIEFLKVVFLGIVEGITEWLPISSTGHMILVDEFISLNVTKEFRDVFFVVIQLGAIMAVIVMYFNKLWPFSGKEKYCLKKDTWILWFKIFAACIPAAVIGILFEDAIDRLFMNSATVAVTLILYGIIFIVVEKNKSLSKGCVTEISQITYKMAFMIGIFQLLALIPGTSRSGATIIGAMLIGASRQVAAEFTFYLAVPVMAGASLLKVVKYITEGMTFSGNELAIMAAGMITAFIVSIFAIKFLVGYIKKNDFTAFGWYRIVLGTVVAGYFIFK